MFGFLKRKTVLKEELEGIDLKYQKHPFSNSIKISIKGKNSALVTMPKNVGFSHAKDFVRANLPWLKNCFEKYSFSKSCDDISDLRKKAKEVLPKKLEELAKKHGFSYKGLRINNAKTRWGSCSYRNNINLNLNLMRLEDDLIEYVILHELAHTVEKNHSKKFWDLLQKHLPNAMELRKKLKKVAL